jgi:hypothetical protein
VPGVCLTNGSQIGVCAGQDPDPLSPTFKAIRDCDTSATAPSTHYKEVLTVFLAQPMAVCGNAVCEGGEDGSCPTDCHPGTWTRSYPSTFHTYQTNLPPLMDTFPEFHRLCDGSDRTRQHHRRRGDTTATVDLDGVMLSAVEGAGVIVKYNPDGSYAWPNFRAGGSGTRPRRRRFTSAESRWRRTADITVMGASGLTLWLVTFDAAGTPLVTRTWTLGTSPGMTKLSPGRSVSVDLLGNTFIAANLGARRRSPPRRPPRSRASKEIASSS